MNEPRGHQSPVADFVIVYSTTERPFSHKQRKLISEKRHRGHSCVSGARVWCLAAFCFFIIRKGGHLHGSPASHSQKDDLVFSTQFLGCCSCGKKRDGGLEWGRGGHDYISWQETWHPRKWVSAPQRLPWELRKLVLQALCCAT